MNARRLLLGDWTRPVRDVIDVLRLSYLGAAVVFLVLGNNAEAVRMAFTFALLMIARAFSLPRPFDLGLVVGMMLQAWGNAFGLFTSWNFYDNIVHVSLTAFAAPVFYIGLARLGVVPGLTTSTPRHHWVGIFVITLSLAMAFGVVYEIYEWFSDHALGGHLIIGEQDTIDDLFGDTVGGAIGGALLVVWAAYGWGTSRRVPPQRLNHQPAASAAADTTAGATRASADETLKGRPSAPPTAP